METGTVQNKFLLVFEYMKGIPKQLLDIFLPKTVEDMARLEATLLQKQLDRPDKRKAKTLRMLHQDELPLSSRRWSLRDIQARVNILKLKKDRKYQDRTGDGGTA